MASSLQVTVVYKTTRQNAQEITDELTTDITALNGVSNIIIQDVITHSTEPTKATIQIQFEPHINKIGQSLITQTIKSFPYLSALETKH